MMGKKDKGMIKRCVNDERVWERNGKRERVGGHGEREAGLLKLMRY